MSNVISRPDRGYFLELFVASNNQDNIVDKARAQGKIYSEICEYYEKHYEPIVLQQEKQIEQLKDAASIVDALNIIKEVLKK